MSEVTRKMGISEQIFYRWIYYIYLPSIRPWLSYSPLRYLPLGGEGEFVGKCL